MIKLLGVIQYLGMSWSGGRLWSAICIFMILLDERMLSNGDCMVKSPHRHPVFDTYLRKFGWKAPRSNTKAQTRFVSEGEEVTFFCEFGFVDVNFQGKVYKFVCTDGKYNGSYYFEDLFCKNEFHKNTKAVLISNLQLGSDIFKCEGRNREVFQVGTKQPDGKLKPLYKVCFDANLMKTKFTYQPQSYESYIEEPDARKDIWAFDYFGNSAKERYKLADGYVAKMQSYRGTVQYYNKYSKENPYPHVFSRGHLATYAHIFAPEDRKATCLYINAAPQWDELNKHTWTNVEHEVKDLIMGKPSAWEIYTGTYGCLLTAKGTPLFFAPFFEGNGKLVRACVPVPKLIWKYVRNMNEDKLSRVYVGINNPDFKSESAITPDFVICKPKPHGKRKFRGSGEQGFAYECNVDEFLSKLSTDEKIIKDN